MYQDASINLDKAQPNYNARLTTSTDSPINMHKLLDKLNPQQAEAVSAKRGNILVLAGAGSGKTRILVHRIAWLLSEEDLRPYNILAVTFTNKAANEMKRRISSLLNKPLGGEMWVGTFHGLANRMLRMHHEAAGLVGDFQIIDSDDQKRMIKRLLADNNIDESFVRPPALQAFINKHKDAGRRSAEASQRARNLPEQRMAGLYQQYELSCERAQVVDFAELLLRAYELLADNPMVLQTFRNRFLEILVDEFQDTNSIQYAWLRKLAGKDNNIMAVGDDDQSIYGWRGAQIANIRAFPEQMPSATIIRSEQNYRSTDTILQAANALIRHNDNRLGKELWTDYGLGEEISYYRAFNPQDEASHLVQSVIANCERHNWKLSDCAMLYRSNAQSRVLEEALLHYNLPYRIYGGQRFFERLEVKNTLAYARLLVNENDDTAFDRVINTPPRGLGERSLEQIRAQARTQEISLWQAAQSLATNSEGRTAQNLLDFFQLIELLRELAADLTLADTFDAISEHSGLLNMYDKQDKEKAKVRKENLDELVSAARQFTPSAEGTGLAEFLQHVVLDSEAQADGDEEAVQLMTLHSAKGLEFSWVAIAGFEDGLLPHKSSFEHQHLIEEERRLAYVGITRAMRKLTLSNSEMRMAAGRSANNEPSRFFWEIPKELIDTGKSTNRPRASMGNTTNRTRASRPSPVFSPNYSRATSKTANLGQITPEPSSAQAPKFQIGANVYHAIFGNGVVEDYQQGSGHDDRVLVTFEKRGSKWLLLEFANLVAAD